ncbi:MAG: hypothetical protein LUH03_08715 [Oscillospiraceae bacterium]|nr:hypothetical protein [Oscillospiraceae bacterium]
MFLLKLPFKIIALPLVAVLALVKWAGIFLTHFSALWFDLFAGLCFLVTVLGYPMHVCTGQEAIRILVMGFVSFLIPVVADGVIATVAAVQSVLWGFICS